jgi:hypothetical protein
MRKHSGDSLLPHLPAKSRCRSPNQVLAIGAPGAMMRKKLRKTVGLIQAALIGTLAAAAIAGIALWISHS